MKGIILAGGVGTRLYPITKVMCKQLLPIYDKPLIYYPMSVLMLAGIKDILIISTPKDTPIFKDVFGDGSHLGLNLSYKVQDKPNGLAEAFILGEDFIGDDDVCLILGDNIFYGHGFTDLLKNAKNKKDGATVFGYWVKDPERYGVVDFDKSCNKVLSLEEKPSNPKSNYAVVGLYFYDNEVVNIAKKLKPSTRGELEITDINKEYLKKDKLNVEIMGRGYTWLDTGTFESMIEASVYIKAIEDRQGLKIACLEEIALNQGFINDEQFLKLAGDLIKSPYGQYLDKIYEERQEMSCVINNY